MRQKEFMVDKDIQMIRELRDISQERLAADLGVARTTVERWEQQEVEISETNIEKLYTYAYRNNININKIKEQLYREDYEDDRHKLLLHGAKSFIEGNLDVSKSRENNDFGKGFYCGETLEQAAMFVSAYPKSSIYMMSFCGDGLSSIRYSVNQDWMLTIAYFRGRLATFCETPKIKSLIQKIEAVDYIVAPIADNRMFQIIDSFIDGEITDEQCRHCLSATNLGYQYIFKTQKALDQIEILERCYLCEFEKELYIKNRKLDNKVSEDKIKVAKRQYRGKGLYIDEILI